MKPSARFVVFEHDLKSKTRVRRSGRLTRRAAERRAASIPRVEGRRVRIHELSLAGPRASFETNGVTEAEAAFHQARIEAARRRGSL